MIWWQSTLGSNLYDSGTGTWNASGDITIPYCADQMRLEFIGAADTWRGRVIRAFLWLMEFWPRP